MNKVETSFSENILSKHHPSKSINCTKTVRFMFFKWKANSSDQAILTIMYIHENWRFCSYHRKSDVSEVSLTSLLEHKGEHRSFQKCEFWKCHRPRLLQWNIPSQTCKVNYDSWLFVNLNKILQMFRQMFLYLTPNLVKGRRVMSEMNKKQHFL